MQSTVKLVCRGKRNSPHSQRLLPQRFRFITNGAEGWQVVGDTSHQRASVSRLTGAMLHGESTAADYRHDIVCQGCGMKLDRTGSKLIARLDEALARGEKVLFLDQLQ